MLWVQKHILKFVEEKVLTYLGTKCFFIYFSNALLQFCLKLERCKPQKALHHPTKCDVINDAKTISDSILQDILLQNFDVIQSDIAIQNQVH